MFSFLKKNKKDAQINKTLTVVEIEDYSDVAPIAKYIKEQTGINFDRQQGILKSKMTSFCKIRDIKSFQTCQKRVLDEPVLKQDLINYITTNETYFYREFRQIEDFVNHVKTEHKKIDVLCAPCASGEEPYSLAIALLEANISYQDFTITAIDISTEALDLAKRAIYKERNVKNLSDELKSKYFDFKDNTYILKDQIKNLVTFTQINVFDNEFKELGKFDYVFSRNMLIYFDKETKLKAKDILESMLKDKEKAVYFGHADLY